MAFKTATTSQPQIRFPIDPPPPPTRNVNGYLVQSLGVPVHFAKNNNVGRSLKITFSGKAHGIGHSPFVRVVLPGWSGGPVRPDGHGLIEVKPTPVAISLRNGESPNHAAKAFAKALQARAQGFNVKVEKNVITISEQMHPL